MMALTWHSHCFECRDNLFMELKLMFQCLPLPEPGVIAICWVSKPYAAFYGVLLYITGYVVGWLEGKNRSKQLRFDDAGFMKNMDMLDVQSASGRSTMKQSSVATTETIYPTPRTRDIWEDFQLEDGADHLIPQFQLNYISDKNQNEILTLLRKKKTAQIVNLVVGEKICRRDGRHLVGENVQENPTFPCGYQRKVNRFRILITRRSCGSNPISATSKVLRIHRGSKDFFFVLLRVRMVGYFYVWWDLEGCIWAADGR